MFPSLFEGSQKRRRAGGATGGAAAERTARGDQGGNFFVNLNSESCYIAIDELFSPLLNKYVLKVSDTNCVENKENISLCCEECKTVQILCKTPASVGWAGLGRGLNCR